MHQRTPLNSGTAALCGNDDDLTDRKRGGRFFVLQHEVWTRLWQVETDNRLNLLTAFLVLLAGTGANHRLSKWSAHACEQYAGMGKPRARKAIDELLASGLIQRGPASSANFPQYVFAAIEQKAEPIFLPVPLITGLAGELPLLRRVRETGDALLLRLLIDLYGAVGIDRTMGLPLASVRQFVKGDEPSRIVCPQGANAIWQVQWGDTRTMNDALSAPHAERKEGRTDWDGLWRRFDLLQTLGAIWFEPWVFGGVELDAEPLYPLLPFQPRHRTPETRVLHDAIGDAVYAAMGDVPCMLHENKAAPIMLPTHYRQPRLFGVLRLTVEADSPGRRFAYAQRMAALADNTAAYEALCEELQAQRRDVPIRVC